MKQVFITEKFKDLSKKFQSNISESWLPSRLKKHGVSTLKRHQRLSHQAHSALKSFMRSNFSM